MFTLTPNGSKIFEAAFAGYLDQFIPDLKPPENPFVAVEYDIFSNYEWDPPGEHVGIDINDVKYVANVSWLSNIAILEGKRNEAWISNDSSSHN